MGFVGLSHRLGGSGGWPQGGVDIHKKLHGKWRISLKGKLAEINLRWHDELWQTPGILVTIDIAHCVLPDTNYTIKTLVCPKSPIGLLNFIHHAVREVIHVKNLLSFGHCPKGPRPPSPPPSFGHFGPFFVNRTEINTIFLIWARLVGWKVLLWHSAGV